MTLSPDQPPHGTSSAAPQPSYGTPPGAPQPGHPVQPLAQPAPTPEFIDLRPRTLRWSTGRWLIVAVVTLIGLVRGLGAVVGSEGGERTFWIVLFGALYVFIAYAVIRSPRLTIDAEGFTLRGPFQSTHETWATCGEFQHVLISRELVVGLRADTFRTEHPDRAARNLAKRGVDYYFKADLGGLSAPYLAAMLQAYRDAYGPAQTRPAVGTTPEA